MLTSGVHKVAILLAISAVAASSLPWSDISSNTVLVKGCEIPYSSKEYIGYHWPLIFRLNGSFYDTVNVDGYDSVVVASGEEVLISCGPNYIKSMEKLEQINAKCGPEGLFRLPGQVVGLKLRDLRCDLRPIEETMQQVYGCPSNLTSARFGYTHPLQRHAFIIGESCYNMVAGKTYFAHVKLGGSLGYLQKADKTLLQQNHPDPNYKTEFLKAVRFDEIYERIRNTLGIKEAPGFSLSRYVDESFMTHNQLNAVKRLSWNYFLVRDNLFTLDLLKDDIRDLSSTMELDIYTGSHGVNVLKSLSGEQIELYADVDDGEKRFPMPELIWILVKNADKAVAFGVFNDPDSQPGDVTRKSICKSECEKITWLTRLANSKQRGPLICCRYDDFIPVVTEVPHWTGINDLLI